MAAATYGAEDPHSKSAGMWEGFKGQFWGLTTFRLARQPDMTVLGVV